MRCQTTTTTLTVIVKKNYLDMIPEFYGKVLLNLSAIGSFSLLNEN